MNKKSLKEMIRDGELKPENLSSEDKRRMEQIKDLADRYKDKSSDELARELERMGTREDIKKYIDSGKLDSFANALRPMLGREQTRKLDQILGKLKK